MQDAVIDTDMRLLGAEHLLTLSAKAARADLLLMRGDAEHARSVQEQVLAARKRLLGAEHADTLRSKTALAHTLLQMQELEAARSLLEAVLHAHLRRLGPDHPETSKAREQLMDVHMQLGLPAGEPPVAPSCTRMPRWTTTATRWCGRRGAGGARIRAPACGRAVPMN
jgi:hypothetical protein